MPLVQLGWKATDAAPAQRTARARARVLEHPRVAHPAVAAAPFALQVPVPRHLRNRLLGGAVWAQGDSHTPLNYRTGSISIQYK
jgi:hypothetical protein